MQRVPEWLLPVVQQFPVVVVVLGALWVVLKWVNATHRENLAREKARADERIAWVDAELARGRQERDELKKEHREHVAQMTEFLREEITQLRSRNTKLQNQLDVVLGRVPKEDEE